MLLLLRRATERNRRRGRTRARRSADRATFQNGRQRSAGRTASVCGTGGLKPRDLYLNAAVITFNASHSSGNPVLCTRVPHCRCRRRPALRRRRYLHVRDRIRPRATGVRARVIIVPLSFQCSSLNGGGEARKKKSPRVIDGFDRTAGRQIRRHSSFRIPIFILSHTSDALCATCHIFFSRSSSPPSPRHRRRTARSPRRLNTVSRRPGWPQLLRDRETQYHLRGPSCPKSSSSCFLVGLHGLTDANPTREISPTAYF